LLVALLALTGCSRQDKERLMRVGGRVSTRADTLIAGPRDKLTEGWKALRAGWDQVSLDARVSARLRWDKSLEGSAIHVHADGDTVRLEGTVRDLGQQRRAVELANSTIGANQVLDQLKVATSEP
jgi:hypothetical protein